MQDSKNYADLQDRIRITTKFTLKAHINPTSYIKTKLKAQQLLDVPPHTKRSVLKQLEHKTKSERVTKNQ